MEGSLRFDPANLILASVASAWEIAVKKRIGRLDAPDDLEEAVEAAGFSRRLISFADVRRAGSLPHHHRDPFDRVLIAQALEDGTPIVTSDRVFASYQVQIIW